MRINENYCIYTYTTHNLFPIKKSPDTLFYVSELITIHYQTVDILCLALFLQKPVRKSFFSHEEVDKSLVFYASREAFSASSSASLCFSSCSTSALHFGHVKCSPLIYP